MGEPDHARRAPLGLDRHLRQHPLSAAQVERTWQGIRERRERPYPPWLHPLLGVRPRLSLGLAVAACCAVLAASVLWSTSDGRWLRFGAGADVAALVQADGRPVELIEAPALGAAHVALSDGSAIDVLDGGRLQPLELSPRAAVWHLLRGRARFAVRPNGPRRWIVEAGAASVEVVGTHFEVVRERDATRVLVQEGKVLVRSPSLPDGVAQLTAGQSLRVVGSDAAARGAIGTATPQPVVDTLTSSTGAAPGTAHPAEAATGSATREPGPPASHAPRATRTREAPASLEAAGAPDAPDAPDAEALLASADEARLSRDPARALAALERLVRELPNDPRAALAAFTIGRIQERDLGDPAAAADGYARALGLGLRGALVDDARARLARARDAAGQHDAAAEVAAQYLARSPRGRHAADMRALLSERRARQSGATQSRAP